MAPTTSSSAAQSKVTKATGACCAGLKALVPHFPLLINPMTNPDYRAMTEHPITPPPELVEKWVDTLAWQQEDQVVFTQAAQWGADQELEACITWLDEMQLAGSGDIEVLRNARRPKPPTLKRQAIAELEKVHMLWDTTEFSQDTLDSLDTIRRALEALPND